MQSYAEVYQRYFDPNRFAPGSPKTVQKELPRASAYQALVSLKQKYHCDGTKPLDVNDLPTSAPLFDNDELLARAEQVTNDWTQQHPDCMLSSITKTTVGTSNAAAKTTTTAAAPSTAVVQEETRRQAQNLWKIWTRHHHNQKQKERQQLTEPDRATHTPRRVSDTAAALSPKQQEKQYDGMLSARPHSYADSPSHRGSAPAAASAAVAASATTAATAATASQQQWFASKGSKSTSMYDTNDVKVLEKTADPSVPCQTVPTSRPVPATAPIDDNTGQASLPVTSDRPIDAPEQQNDISKNVSYLDQCADTESNQRQDSTEVNPTASTTRTSNNNDGTSNVLSTQAESGQYISGNNNKELGTTTAAAMGTGAVAAGTTAAATGTSLAGPTATKMEGSPSNKPAAALQQNEQKNVSFASNNNQANKGDDNTTTVKNTGGTKEHIAEQPELYHNGGLTGEQPVGKIDLKNL